MNRSRLVIKSKLGYFCQSGRYSSNLYWTKDKNDPNIVYFKNNNDIKNCIEQVEFKEFCKVKYMIMPVDMQDRFIEMADNEW